MDLYPGGRGMFWTLLVMLIVVSVVTAVLVIVEVAEH
jgi:hypothetical protein